MRLSVLRLGWNPQASKPGLIDRLFRAREQKAAEPVPAPALPASGEGPPPVLSKAGGGF